MKALIVRRNYIEKQHLTFTGERHRLNERYVIPVPLVPGQFLRKEPTGISTTTTMRGKTYTFAYAYATVIIITN